MHGPEPRPELIQGPNLTLINAPVPPSQAACMAFLHSSSPEKRYQVEGQFIHASRPPIWIRLTVSQIDGGHPRDPPFVTCMVEDITVLREAQKELSLALDRISAIVPKHDFQGEYTLEKALDAIPGMVQKYKTLFELSIVGVNGGGGWGWGCGMLQGCWFPAPRS